MKLRVNYMIFIWQLITVAVFCITSSEGGNKNDIKLSLAKRNLVRSGSSAGAVMILLKISSYLQGRRPCTFNETMNRLEKYWRPTNDYPVYLLTDEIWPEDVRTSIANQWKSLDINFLDITTVFRYLPDLTNENVILLNMTAKKLGGYSMSYRQMCAFFTEGFLQISQLMQYKYLLRIDEDACIMNPIPYDIFQLMEKYNTSYAYSGMFLAPDTFTQTQYEFITNFITTHKINIANPRLMKLYQTVYKNNKHYKIAFATNFEVINIQRYQQNDIMKFVKAINDSKSIYVKRWGDAPLRFLLSVLYFHKSEVLRLTEFAYHHHSLEYTFPRIANREHSYVNPVINIDFRPGGKQQVKHFPVKCDDNPTCYSVNIK